MGQGEESGHGAKSKCLEPELVGSMAVTLSDKGAQGRGRQPWDK